MARARARLFLPAPAARTAGGWPKTVLAVSYDRRAQAAKRFAALAPRLAEHGWIVPYGAATAEADGSITLDVCGQAAALLALIHVLDPAARVATRLVTGDHAVVPPP